MHRFIPVFLLPRVAKTILYWEIFHPNTQTIATIVNSSSTNEVAFYHVDDISVTECNVGIEENNLSEGISIYHEKGSDNIFVKMPARYSVDDLRFYNSVGQGINLVHTE